MAEVISTKGRVRELDYLLVATIQSKYNTKKTTDELRNLANKLREVPNLVLLNLKENYA